MTDHYNMGSYNTSDNGSYISPEDLLISRMVNDITSYEMEMTEAVNMRMMPKLTERLTFRTHSSKYILPMMNKEGGGVESQTIEFFTADHQLTKWSSGVRATYEASLTMDREQQIMQSVQACGEGFARFKDVEILSSLIGGAGISEDASAEWDSSSADIPGDLGGLLTAVFQQEDCDIKTRDVRGMLLYYPMKLMPILNDPVKILTSTSTSMGVTKQQQETDQVWAENAYGFQWRPIKDLNYVGKLIAVIPSKTTADHVTLQSPRIPEVAYLRDERHQIEEWINHRYFGTFVYPSSEDSEGKSYKIMVLNDVCDVTPYPAIATIN
jgi:hypothetical protein